MTDDRKVWCSCGHRRELHADEETTRVNEWGAEERILECQVIYKDNPADRCGCRGFVADKILNQCG
jgi:hypothetical protein